MNPRNFFLFLIIFISMNTQAKDYNDWVENSGGKTFKGACIRILTDLYTAKTYSTNMDDNLKKIVNVEDDYTINKRLERIRETINYEDPVLLQKQAEYETLLSRGKDQATKSKEREIKSQIKDKKKEISKLAKQLKKEGKDTNQSTEFKALENELDELNKEFMSATEMVRLRQVEKNIESAKAKLAKIQQKDGPKIKKMVSQVTKMEQKLSEDKSKRPSTLKQLTDKLMFWKKTEEPKTLSEEEIAKINESIAEKRKKIAEGRAVVQALEEQIKDLESELTPLNKDQLSALVDIELEKQVQAQVYNRNLSTPALIKRYGKIAKKVRWQLWMSTPHHNRNIEILTQLERGATNPVEIYGKDSYKGWSNARTWLEEIPDEKFEFSVELLTELNRRSAINDIGKFSKILQKLYPNRQEMWWKAAGALRNAKGRLGGLVDRVRGTSELVKESTYQTYMKNEYLGVNAAGEQVGFIETPFYPTVFHRLIGKEVEVPEGYRYGFINYPKGARVEELLNKLMNFANEEMAKTDIAHAKVMSGELEDYPEDVLDPIELWAHIQYKLISIHPYYDVNGRTTKLLADRILQKYDVSPPHFLENDFDINYPLERSNADLKISSYVDKVREAVLRGVNNYEQALKDHENAKWLKEAPHAYKINKKDTPVSRIWMSAEVPEDLKPIRDKYLQQGDELLPETAEKEFIIGGTPFVMMRDGFFVNPRGIRHVYREDTNSMVPISQKAYDLYTNAGAEANGIELELVRGISPDHLELYIDNLRFVQKYVNKEVDASEVKKVEYDVIADAENNNKIYLHDFQRDMVSKATKINIDLNDKSLSKEELNERALRVLHRVRGGVTNFERFHIKGFDLEKAEVLAQYVWVDFQYKEYLKFAKESGDKALQDEVWEARKTLHQAGQILIDDFYKKTEKLKGPKGEIIRDSKIYKLTKEYFEVTNLSKPWWKVRLGALFGKDNYTPLFRADYKWAPAIGFIDEMTYKNMIKSMKAFGFSAEDFIKELHHAITEMKVEHLALTGTRSRGERHLKRVTLEDVFEYRPELKEKMSPLKRFFMGKTAQYEFDYFIANINELLESEFSVKGAQQEFESIFVNMIHHMIDKRAVKKGASYSTSPRLYIKKGEGQEELPFVNDSFMLPARLHIVMVHDSLLVRNIYNTYLNQNEFVSALKRAKGKINGFLDATAHVFTLRFGAAVDDLRSIVKFKKTFTAKTLLKEPTFETPGLGVLKKIFFASPVRAWRDFKISIINKFKKEGKPLDYPEDSITKESFDSATEYMEENFKISNPRKREMDENRQPIPHPEIDDDPNVYRD